MKPEDIQRHKILIIGNKPYANFPFNNIIDKFDRNIRCGTVLPGHNNGTKYDSLALCSHFYHNLVNQPLSREGFVEFYKEDFPKEYLKRYYDSFPETKSRYKEIFFAQHHPEIYNRMLAEWGCPHRFSKIPRLGCTLIFENLRKNNNVFITFFSLYDKVRVSRNTIKEARGRPSCHSPSDEMPMLIWLHENKFIDATLCMLEDREVPTLNCKDLQPSEFIVNLLKEEHGDVLETK